MRLRLTLGTLLIACVATASWSTAAADAGEEAACRLDCNAESQQCIEVCGDHPDPVECETDCQDRAQDCYERCS